MSSTKLTPTMVKTLTNLQAIGGRVVGYLENMRAAGIHGKSIDALVRRGLAEDVPSLTGDDNTDYAITDAGRAALTEINGETPETTVPPVTVREIPLTFEEFTAIPANEETQESAQPAPKLSLPFEPAYVPNTVGGTDIHNGNGELMGFTWKNSEGFTATIASDESDSDIALCRTDAAAQFAILQHFGTPVESGESEETQEINGPNGCESCGAAPYEPCSDTLNDDQDSDTETQESAEVKPLPLHTYEFRRLVRNGVHVTSGEVLMHVKARYETEALAFAREQGITGEHVARRLPDTETQESAREVPCQNRREVITALCLSASQRQDRGDEIAAWERKMLASAPESTPKRSGLRTETPDRTARREARMVSARDRAESASDSVLTNPDGPYMIVSRSASHKISQTVVYSRSELIECLDAHGIPRGSVRDSESMPPMDGCVSGLYVFGRDKVLWQRVARTTADTLRGGEPSSTAYVLLHWEWAENVRVTDASADGTVRVVTSFGEIKDVSAWQLTTHAAYGAEIINVMVDKDNRKVVDLEIRRSDLDDLADFLVSEGYNVYHDAYGEIAEH